MIIDMPRYGAAPGDHPARQLADRSQARTRTLATAALHHLSLLRLSWIEARPVVQLMFLLRFLTAVTITAAVSAGSGGHVVVHKVVLSAAAWVCATWFTYLLNGLCDQVEDKGNGSRRPIATGALPVPEARRIAAGLAIAAVVFASLTTHWVAVCVLVMLTLGWSYSAGQRPQKATPIGFVVVVFGGGTVTYLAGAQAAGGAPGRELLVLMCSMSLWMALAGSTKDLSDVDGDRAAGRRTLPVILGDHLARRVMAALTVGVGLLMLAATQAFAPGLAPLAWLLLIGASAVATALMINCSGPANRDRRRLPYRLFMITQWTVHIAAVGAYTIPELAAAL